MDVRQTLSVVILTHNEEIHIGRCINSLKNIADNIFVVDSYSTDRTVEIAGSLGAVVALHKWKNYSDQFRWGLNHLEENCGKKSDWVMRMDADEYLEADLIQELGEMLKNPLLDISGFYIRRKVYFYGRWIRHGGFYPQILLRIWRSGIGRIEQRWMDEHIVLPAGSKMRVLKGHLVDNNLKGITFWINKHNSYASREMVDLLNNKYSLYSHDRSLRDIDDPQAKWKRIVKDEIYSRMPLGLRAMTYFFYRYIVRLGFLDGGKGFIWHFMQGFWYRMLVDIKIMEIEERCGEDVEKIRQLLKEEYGIDL